MYFKEEELVVESPTRSPKPVSQTAENITVITASDIELMNAHTLAEVLNTITGVQVWMHGGPGTMAAGYIQGSETRHVTIIIDGVVLNNIGDNAVDSGMIPVQNIEKIEIIKGPASSAWGSALGGVMNIITKSGSMDNKGGMISASYGTKNTGDFRAEARDKHDRFSYYLTAGRLQSNGLTTPNFDVSENNAYAKLMYDITQKTNVLLSLGYEKTSRGDGSDPPGNDTFYDNTWEIMHSTLALNSALNKNLELNVSVRAIRQVYETETSGLSQGDERYSDRGYGSSAKLTWKDTSQTVVFGADYDDKIFKSDFITGGEQGTKKWAVYANDTISFDKLTITPGVRYDDTDSSGAITSPSLGIAYSFANSTMLRLYAAKGFNISPLGYTYIDTTSYSPNTDLKMEKVRSYQAGAETAALKYLWMKVSVFWNEIRDAISQAPSPVDSAKSTYVNEGRQRRRGVDFEVKTHPVYNTSLSAGAEYVDAKDLDTGLRLELVPTHIYDVGLRYDDEQSFKALLIGRYINWNAPPDYNAKYNSFVFDLHMIKKIYQRRDAALEAFADAHNLFNGSQYAVDTFKNPERWFEGGIRYKF